MKYVPMFLRNLEAKCLCRENIIQKINSEMWYHVFYNTNLKSIEYES